MEGYLGETPVDVANHAVYSNYTPENWAMYFISRYGGIEGDHHRAWVLDQVSRILNGTPIAIEEARWSNGHTEMRVSTGEPSAAYLAWVEKQLGGTDEYGDRDYSYDAGIAP